jgi:hypothetical protein
MKVYKKIRNFTKAELEEEVGEYFQNAQTFKKFPNLANTPEELVRLIKDAEVAVLTKKQLMSLDNSDVGDVLKSDDPYKQATQIAKENERNINKIFKGIINNSTFPMPIVINKSGNLYLMAGNTRLCAFAALNMTIPVKIIISS